MLLMMKGRDLVTFCQLGDVDTGGGAACNGGKLHVQSLNVVTDQTLVQYHSARHADKKLSKSDGCHGRAR